MPTPEQIRQTDPISTIFQPRQEKEQLLLAHIPRAWLQSLIASLGACGYQNFRQTNSRRRGLGPKYLVMTMETPKQLPSRGNLPEGMLMLLTELMLLLLGSYIIQWPQLCVVNSQRSYHVRRMVTPEDNPFIESDTSFGIAHIRSDVSGSRHHRHVRHGLGEGLAEIVMLQSSLLMGRRSDGVDRYRDMRLDIDNMSYEDLLELSERIGYVSTGLRDEEIDRCLGRTKLAVSTDLSLRFALEMERKCSICQEEYESDVETGKLSCGHSYHIHCIQQWLRQKNSCPICKSSATSQNKAA